MKKISKMNILINWCFLLYMLVLGGERVQSLVNCFIKGPDFAFSSFMVGSYNIIVLASLGISLVLLFILNRDFLKALFTNGEVNYKKLILTSGILLLSGMMHTDYTILPIQFVSYAFLILALVFETILVQKEGKNKALLWSSLAYLVAYSMAIPVNYISSLEGNALFHSVQLLTTLITLLHFIHLSGKVFAGEGEHLFYYLPIFFLILGDTFLIVFRWNEYVNLFLFVALIATVILFAAGKMLEHHYRQEENK